MRWRSVPDVPLRWLSPPVALLVFGFLAWTYPNAVSAHDRGIVPGVIPLTAVGLAIAMPFIVRARRDGLAFITTTLAIGLITATIFLNLYPRVMVSSTSSAFDLTVWNTSSSHYTLVVMTIVALSDDTHRVALPELDVLRVSPSCQPR